LQIVFCAGIREEYVTSPRTFDRASGSLQWHLVGGCVRPSTVLWAVCSPSARGGPQGYGLMIVLACADTWEENRRSALEEWGHIAEQ
jgi:hypothetical protein